MTGTADSPLLDVQEISAYADGARRPLLDRVALTVPAGTVTAVVGPSGSGKTTLGLAALGASRSGVRLAGRVLLGDTDLLLLPPSRRPGARAGRAAHLPQHPETVLDPIRRAGGTLTELAALGHPDRRARKAAARRALTLAGLEWETVRRRFPHQLSGGQQQRLALASALVTGARLLVLDEPTSGLDPALAHALGRTVRALADGGTGVLLLSHDLRLVRETADRAVVLEHGRAVDGGPAADVLRTVGPGPAPSRHRATRELLAAEHGTRPDGDAAPDTAAPAPEGGGVTATGIVVRRRAGDPLTGPVSLEFRPGSRTALLGPSGSGKTTFARVLAGLTAPTLGDVRSDGRPLPRRIDRRTAAQRRAVQYVHQSSADSFEAHRPVLGQLADTARLLRGLPEAEATDEARTAAGVLGLDEELLHRTPDRLSGGQLQRCALVRALTAHPALLVCDEVTSALDTVSRQRVMDALPRLLAPARTALLFVSHDLPAVRALTEEAALFDGGRCVRHGPVGEVLPAAWTGVPLSS
ncbi:MULTISPECIES: ATP-binding cassette domain-containing protein [unclassified Streptomyces]|uniref:ABC transporter ATP-binding protein n=1 Tax=Streptomyces TaxID=1883 RepID=UPI0001C1C522|nr:MULTISPECIES: ATP-binding cassette domain-containing protein [unclassified Streptomyces]MYR68183.1 ATP-binding cassette domain-containing protein [Streptomyces sp. SID4939]MYS03255.1 ATP-binding cassette domain-containing protein [Streptomyces sp. SID4940]MYT66851.1 ATP-binding cassette domain-containing protein [Streptomyces sp. SID8357]MYT88372.1 ATP-binding cassette domain-containing protein [Streptomyces sp. SID8360]MYU33285.1 ATP-binding cassette domain-containing protein [Streptomyces